MFSFSRRIDKEFVDALRVEYAKGGWWQSIIDDPELFVGIRENYINVYYQGSSLMLLKFENGNFIGKTHYKYLLKAKVPSPYVEWKTNNLEGFQGEDWGRYFIETPVDVESLKKASKPYAGDEKVGVHKIILANKNIVDLEIALTKEASDSDVEEISNKVSGASAQRIDFAAFQESGQGIELVFFEAKHYSNRAALRKGKGDAEAIEQVEKYKDLIEKYRRNIEESYRNVCANLVALYPPNSFDPVVEGVANNSPFTVSSEPRLVVFGFDKDQREGEKFKHHMNKLQENLGKGRVLLVGNPEGFQNGISFPKR